MNKFKLSILILVSLLLGSCTTEESLNEKDLLEKIKKTKDLQKYLSNKDIIKTIFIKNKLINLIVK